MSTFDCTNKYNRYNDHDHNKVFIFFHKILLVGDELPGRVRDLRVLQGGVRGAQALHRRSPQVGFVRTGLT